MSRPRKLQICDCPRARHEHGTRGMYDRHKCHCITCAPARIADGRARKPLNHEWADPALARERIVLLRASGLSLDAISELSAVHISQLRALLPVRGPNAMKKVRATTVAALSSIRAKDVAAVEVPLRAKVCGDSARLQLQSLYCRGWSVDSLHERSGLAKSALYGLLGGDSTTEGFRLRVAALHDDLSGHRAPQSTERDRGRASRAVAKAAAHNWTTDTEMAAERLLLELALAA